MFRIDSRILVSGVTVVAYVGLFLLSDEDKGKCEGATKHTKEEKIDKAKEYVIQER